MMKTYPIHAAALAFPPLKGAEMDGLKKSLLEHGQQFPVVLLDGAIIDGRNRQEAFVQLAKEKKLPADFKLRTVDARDTISPAAFAKVANIDRRHLTESQLAMVATKLLPMFRKEAKARQAAAAKATNRARKGGKKTPTLPAPGRTSAAKEAAKAVGGKVSSRSVERAERIRKASPELAQKVLDGELDAKQAERKLNRKAHEAQVLSYVVPAGEWSVIVVDFSWMYENNRDEHPDQRSGADYPRMTDEEICAFPIPAAANCLLGCWITNQKLIDGTWEKVRLSLKERYGFRPVIPITWTKLTKSGSGPNVGLGAVIRNNTEHLILLERGDVAYRETGGDNPVPLQFSGFEAPVGRGSEKPQKAFDIIEAICPMVPRLEMFARPGSTRPGWARTGSELAAEDNGGQPADGRSATRSKDEASVGGAPSFSPAGGPATPELTVVPDEADVARDVPPRGPFDDLDF